MPKLPDLMDARGKAMPCNPGQMEGLLFAVYAPFGGDPVLSNYPGDAPQGIRRHPLVVALGQVARQGVNVAALVDLRDDFSYLVEIAAGRSGAMDIHPVWKQSMSDPHALAGFLRRAHARFPCRSLALALEGHGAGFLPELDATRVTPASTTGSGIDRWEIDASGTQAKDGAGHTVGPADPYPPLPVDSYPMLPADSPEGLPANLPMSTWALAEALRLVTRGKNPVPRPAVIHFNNCFNMSMELLHTVAPFARYATGYANYNFFSSGEAYPEVFKELRSAGSATPLQLARWFAAKNRWALTRNNQYSFPTIGATVDLTQMGKVSTALDDMATALVSALRPPANRAANLPLIAGAVKDALHFDTHDQFELRIPDQLIDLGSFAAELMTRFAAGTLVHQTAKALAGRLAGAWQYGDRAFPAIGNGAEWDFRRIKPGQAPQERGINILLPDPGLRGEWDWRSPYYLQGLIDPNKPTPQRQLIPFLTNRPGNKRPPWVEFIVELHKQGTKLIFSKLLRVQPLVFPKFDIKYRPEYPDIGNDQDDIPGKPD